MTTNCDASQSNIQNDSGNLLLGSNVYGGHVNIGGEFCTPDRRLFRVPLRLKVPTVPRPSNEELEERQLAKLPYAVSVTFDHFRWQNYPQCLAGMRSHLLGDIMAWFGLVLFLR